MTKALRGMKAPSSEKPSPTDREAKEPKDNENNNIAYFESAPLTMEATGTTSVDVSEPVEAATDVSDERAKPKVATPWLGEWCEIFTPEQRMVMMASFWNVMEQETRGKAARRLVGILTEGEPALAGLHAGVKGGDFGTLRLDTSVYDHVSRPARCVCNRHV